MLLRFLVEAVVVEVDSSGCGVGGFVLVRTRSDRGRTVVRMPVAELDELPVL